MRANLFLGKYILFVLSVFQSARMVVARQ